MELLIKIRELQRAFCLGRGILSVACYKRKKKQGNKSIKKEISKILLLPQI